MDEVNDLETETGISLERRTALKRLGLALSVAYAAPLVATLSRPAAAASGGGGEGEGEGEGEGGASGGPSGSEGDVGADDDSSSATEDDSSSSSDSTDGLSGPSDP